MSDEAAAAQAPTRATMRNQHDDAVGPLWIEGDMMFRVHRVGVEPDRLVKVRHPYAVLGRTGHAALALDDRDANARHAYLHLDARGVYAVDLVTRTGTRINGGPRNAGWLRPGDWLEVAGRKIELQRIRIGGHTVEPPPCDADPLADIGQDTLAPVALEPRRGTDPPWILASELVFLGSSPSCGIQIKDHDVARTHCALFRDRAGAYLVDLCGRQTWVEDQPVQGATPLHDGDMVTVGSTQFTVRVEPRDRPSLAYPIELVSRPDTGSALARYEIPPGRELASFGAGQFPIHTDLIPAEAQGALMAWMMGTIQGGQGEVLRRQGEFQLAITQVLRQIQQDSATLLNAHLQRIESIDEELAALRAEIERRNARPAPPQVAPLNIPRPATPGPDPGTPAAVKSTTWLLDRVNQLEDENRSVWKDLLGRLSQSKKSDSTGG
jgi:pSer/pThr/pTyr-binding forkhead associated (FHA) protein